MGVARFLVLALLGTALGAVGCGPKPAAAADPNQLVLELGGTHERLADVLDRVRTKNAATTLPRPPSVQVPGAETPAAPTPEPATPTPVKSPRQVRLTKGQTLYALAKLELGDGNRWKELLKLNGWSEAQATKLREGTAVRLPER